MFAFSGLYHSVINKHNMPFLLPHFPLTSSSFIADSLVINPRMHDLTLCTVMFFQFSIQFTSLTHQSSSQLLIPPSFVLSTKFIIKSLFFKPGSPVETLNKISPKTEHCETPLKTALQTTSFLLCRIPGHFSLVVTCHISILEMIHIFSS